MILAPGGWRNFYALSRTRGPDLGSVWYVARVLAGGPVPGLNFMVATMLVFAFTGIAMLALGAPAGPASASSPSWSW